MDGVIWRGPDPIGNLAVIFDQIAKKGLKVGFATNNATASVSGVLEKLRGFGVDTSEENILTSGVATAAYLKKKFPNGGNIYTIGEEGLTTQLEEMGFYYSEQDCLAVVVSLDREFNYSQLNKANRLIRSGIPFIATNPDKTFPVPNGIIPGTGSIAAAIEAASNTPPLVIGKPSPLLFEILLQRLNILPTEALVVGDRYETDIIGGKNAGCQTALVLTGVTMKEAVKSLDPAPDIISESLTSLIGSIN